MEKTPRLGGGKEPEFSDQIESKPPTLRRPASQDNHAETEYTPKGVLKSPSPKRSILASSQDSEKNRTGFNLNFVDKMTANFVEMQHARIKAHT